MPTISAPAQTLLKKDAVAKKKEEDAFAAAAQAAEEAEAAVKDVVAAEAGVKKSSKAKKLAGAASRVERSSPRRIKPLEEPAHWIGRDRCCRLVLREALAPLPLPS